MDQLSIDSYIRDRRKAGDTDDVIVNNLLQAGRSSGAISDALKNAGSPSVVNRISHKSRAFLAKGLPFLAFIGIAFFIGGAIYAEVIDFNKLSIVLSTPILVITVLAPIVLAALVIFILALSIKIVRSGYFEDILKTSLVVLGNMWVVITPASLLFLLLPPSDYTKFNIIFSIGVLIFSYFVITRAFGINFWQMIIVYIFFATLFSVLFFLVSMVLANNPNLIKSQYEGLGTEITNTVQQPEFLNSGSNMPGNISVKTITIHAGPYYNSSVASGPRYELLTGNGHYLILYYGGNFGLLSYDGKNLPSINDLSSGAEMAISKNGLHYAYEIDNGGYGSYSKTLYVDGSPVVSGDNIYFPHVSDDGKTYFYIVGSDSDWTSGSLFRNGSKVVNGPVDGGFTSIDRDGNNYLTLVTAGPRFQKDLLLNDKVVDSGVFIFPDLSLSPNGRHYGYVKTIFGKPLSYNVMVDGKLVASSTDHLDLVGIADNGSYIVVDQKNGDVTVNGNVVAQANASGCKEAATWAYANNDASHIITVTRCGQSVGDKYMLDGRPISFNVPENSVIGGVETVNNTVYVYDIEE